jgi:hypothetical protein
MPFPPYEKTADHVSVARGHTFLLRRKNDHIGDPDSFSAQIFNDAVSSRGFSGFSQYNMSDLMFSHQIHKSFYNII